MKQYKLNLGSENLVIDFLRFNLQFTEKLKIQEVAQYLSKEYSCNTSFKQDKKIYPLIHKNRSRCKAKFITSHTKHWIGTRLEFEGRDAARFYQMLKDNPLNWKHMNLDSTNLGRIDLAYDRPFKEKDRFEEFETFLIDAAEIISDAEPSLHIELKPPINPQSLAIGHRQTSPNYLRVYKTSNGRSIRFELEIKLELVKRFQSFLFTGQFEILEAKLVQHYYQYLTAKFEIDKSCYTDWLLENFRNIRFLQIPNNRFITTYINHHLANRITDQEFVYKLFQLLSFIRQLSYSADFIGDQRYLIISFKVTDFLEFIGTKNNHYQVQKLEKFFTSLQTLPPILITISNLCFQSVNIFPYIKVFKQKSWYVQFAIAEELYFYKYPFYFPEVFLNSQTKYQRQCQISFFLAFSVLDINKVFDVEKFLNKFDISNSNLRKLKLDLIKTFQVAENSKLIKNQFTLVLKNKQKKEVSVLTTSLINKTRFILFKELTKF